MSTPGVEKAETSPAAAVLVGVEGSSLALSPRLLMAAASCSSKL